MKTWFTTDWHLGHEGMVKKFRTNFQSISQHDNFFLDWYKKLVKPVDTVFFLGDVVHSLRDAENIKGLPGRKIIIAGNHDSDRNRDLLATVYNAGFSEIHGCMKFKEFWLTHIPMHPNELFGRTNLHGHVHSNMIKDSRYVNICPEFLVPFFGRPMIHLEELREVLSSDQEFWELNLRQDFLFEKQTARV